MPGWLKALLIVVLVIVLLFAGVIGAGVFWWMRNKDALRARAKEGVAEGRDFGNNTDNQGCLDEAFARYKKEPGFFNGISNQIFLKGCLEASRPSPGFCDNIPMGKFEEMQRWREERCRPYHVQSSRDCQGLLTPVVMYCSERKRREN